MNLWGRSIRVLLLSLVREKAELMGETETGFRVWFHDIDAFGHMNNGRYLQIMDAARTDWMRRTRVLDKILGLGCTALLGGTVIRHCKPLRPFQRYAVNTSLLTWEDRWVFLRHSFHSTKGELMAVGYSRAAICKKGKWVAPQSIADSLCPGTNPPQMPAVVRNWLAVDDGLAGESSFDHLKEPADIPPIVERQVS